MPTGYTAAVQSGEVTDFRTFALRCARAFGACVMQRDAPMDQEPKPREATSYYADRLTEATRRAAELETMTLEEAAAENEAAYLADLRRYDERTRQSAEQMARYNAMLARVVEWAPPSSEHGALKQFMLDQLNESKRFDEWSLPAPKRQSATEWLAAQREKNAYDLAYYAEEARKEAERVESSGRWIQQLYASLEVQP